MNTLLFLAGVSGSGKSTIGQAFARAHSYLFLDADDFHSAENIRKMSSGQALTDTDRWPWLESLAATVSTKIKDTSIVVACSALKESYRNYLQSNLRVPITFVFLIGSKETLLLRLKNRKGHFMGPELLQTQLDTLQVRPGDYTLSIDLPIQQQVDKLKELLVLKG